MPRAFAAASTRSRRRAPDRIRARALGAAWVLGTALSLVFLGFLNLAAGAGSARGASWYSLVANLLALGFMLAVAAILPVPQTLVGVVLLLGLLTTTAERLFRTRHVALGKSPPDGAA